MGIPSWFRWWHGLIALWVAAAVIMRATGVVPDPPPIPPPAAHTQPVPGSAHQECGEKPPHYGNKPLWAVEQHLKARLNDPGSLQDLECTAPAETPRCWRSSCRYRAKNGFGALVLQTGVFYLAKPPGAEFHSVLATE